jgi:hypothetical protein
MKEFNAEQRERIREIEENFDNPLGEEIENSFDNLGKERK